MNIDIANMVVTVGGQMQMIDWLDAGVTLVSVFLGAYLAYRLNLKLELRKSKRQMRIDFCTLASQMWWNLDEMITYKKNILDIIFKSYQEQKDENFLSSIRGPSISFDFDLNKYIFLNDCNRCFLPELKIIQSAHEFLQKRWCFYSERLSSSYQLCKSGDINKIFEIQKIFTDTYDLYNKLCIRLYYLNKHFNECYKRFFNVYCFDDTEDEMDAKIKIEQCVPNALSEEDFIKLNEHFNKYWAPDYTLWEVIKFNYRKFKYYLKGIKIYFFGRGKPKTKRKGKK